MKKLENTIKARILDAIIVVLGAITFAAIITIFMIMFEIVHIRAWIVVMIIIVLSVIMALLDATSNELSKK